MKLSSLQRSVLHTLIEAQSYTGPQIAARVGCSRTTVWRHARLLQVELPRKERTSDVLRYHRRKAAGDCVSCGQSPAADGHVQCGQCRARRKSTAHTHCAVCAALLEGA